MAKVEVFLVYIQEDIPLNLITANFPNAEGFFLKINLREKKCVISCSYNPHNQRAVWHMGSMGKAVDSL